MPPLFFADNFLAGSLLSIVLPLGLLIVIAVWYRVLAGRQVEASPASPSLPPPEVVEAAGPAVAEVTPAEPSADRPAGGLTGPAADRPGAEAAGPSAEAAEAAQAPGPSADRPGAEAAGPYADRPPDRP